MSNCVSNFLAISTGSHLIPAEKSHRRLLKELSMKDIHSHVRRFVVQNFLYGQNGGTLADNDSFLETGIIDSTGVLELISFVEKTFRVSFDDSDLVPENLDSIDNVAAFVSRKRGLSAAGAD